MRSGISEGTSFSHIEGGDFGAVGWPLHWYTYDLKLHGLALELNGANLEVNTDGCEGRERTVERIADGMLRKMSARSFW